MKRVGQKPAQLVRSASRRKKQPSRFQFDITVHTLSSLRPATYLLKWSRGVKVVSTDTFTVSKDVSASVPFSVNRKLTLLVTLYDDGSKFDPKDTKLSLVSVSKKNDRERTVAKTRVDLANFAAVPSSSTQHVINLSDKIVLRSTIESRFLNAGPSGPGSAATSSQLSGVDNASARSSDDQHDDLSDLLIDDVPDPVPTPSLSKPRHSPQPSSATSSSPSVTNPSSQPRRSASPTPKPALLSAFRRRERSALNANPASQPAPFSEARSTSSASNKSDEASRRPPSNPVSTDDEVRNDQRRELAQLRNQLEINGRELSDAQTARSAASTMLADMRVKHDDLKQSVGKLTADLAASRKRADALADVEQRNSALQKDLDGIHAQLKTVTAERTALTSRYDAARSEREDLKTKLETVTRERGDLRSQLSDVSKENEELSLQAKRVKAAEAKSAQLSQEVDRLTVLSSRALPSESPSSDSDEVARRLAALQKEKDSLERKVHGLEAHGAKVKDTYDEVSAMYSKLVEDHTKLQHEFAEERKASREAAATAATAAANATAAMAATPIDHVQKDDDEKNILVEQLEEARTQFRELKLTHDEVMTDHKDLQVECDTLQDRLDLTSETLANTQREVEDLYAETEELKGQRDMAMKRALSKGRNSTGESSSQRGSKVLEEELKVAKEAFQREQGRLTQKVGELETELGDLRDDLEYEKHEKAKAWGERDKMRETARSLERRSSQAARASDELHSVQRELSTQRMRGQDQEAMIQHLKEEIETLRREQDESRDLSFRLRLGENGDEMDVTAMLVEAKLALAVAKSEKQQVEFKMKQQRKQDAMTQKRLTDRLTRLQTRLDESDDGMARYQKRRSTGLESSSEFNELGSDVDY